MKHLSGLVKTVVLAFVISSGSSLHAKTNNTFAYKPMPVIFANLNQERTYERKPLQLFSLYDSASIYNLGILKEIYGVFDRWNSFTQRIRNYKITHGLNARLAKLDKNTIKLTLSYQF